MRAWRSEADHPCAPLGNCVPTDGAAIMAVAIRTVTTAYASKEVPTAVASIHNFEKTKPLHWGLLKYRVRYSINGRQKLATKSSMSPAALDSDVIILFPQIVSEPNYAADAEKRNE